MNPNPKPEEYLHGTAQLPGTFSTAYQRDLEFARELIHLRREKADRSCGDAVERTSIEDGIDAFAGGSIEAA